MEIDQLVDRQNLHKEDCILGKWFVKIRIVLKWLGMGTIGEIL
jgi:hypothetical protein